MGELHAGPWTFSQKFNIATIVGFKVLWVGFYYFCQNIRSCWARPSSWLGVHLIRGHLTQRSIGYLAISIYRPEKENQREKVRGGGTCVAFDQCGGPFCAKSAKTKEDKNQVVKKVTTKRKTTLSVYWPDNAEGPSNLQIGWENK